MQHAAEHDIQHVSYDTLSRPVRRRGRTLTNSCTLTQGVVQFTAHDKRRKKSTEPDPECHIGDLGALHRYQAL